VSYIANKGEQSTSVEIVSLSNLTALPASTTGQFLRKTGVNTYENATPSGSGSGTVTSVSVTTANGVSGSVATSTTTPAITLALGAITPSSVNSVVVSGSSTPTLAVTGTSSISGANTGDQNLSGYELLSNKATTFGTVNNTLYPTVKAVSDFVVSSVAGLLDYRGSYDASTNLFPAAGGSGIAGAILKGDFWIISVVGTLGGNAVYVGDMVIALQDTPAQTAANWNVIEYGLSYVPENAANKVTSISGASTDVQYPSAKLVYDQLAGKGVGDMLLGTAQSITETKTFTKDKLLVKGTSTGTTNITTANTSVTSYTATLPAKDGTVAMTSDITGTNSGTNTGDNAANSTYTIGSQTQAYNANLTAINQALTTTSSPSFTTVTAALTGTASGNLPLAGGTMTGNIQLGENTSLDNDASLSADGKYTGICVAGTAGGTIAFGDIIVLKASTGKWIQGDISVAAAADGDMRGMVGICVLGAIANGATKILLNGVIRADANFPALTSGAQVYGSTTGDIVTTQPSTTDYVIRVLGFAIPDDLSMTAPQSIYFNPSQDYITHI
jgi:hypothetical protein